MQSRGNDVWGSDREDSDVLKNLRRQGIHISLTQDGSAIPEGTELFVFSEAIPMKAPERRLAVQRGIRSLSYFQALGELTAGKNLIAVAGTHGKSSTTAMATKMLMDTGRDPSVVVGTKMRELPGGNWHSGQGDLWVVEACEYRRSFLYLKPRIILVTNADGDHFDAFKDQADYRQAFIEFISALPQDGTLITHGNDPVLREIAAKAKRTIIDADQYPLIQLKTPGLHMQQNAQLVLALANVLGLEQSQVQASLSDFSGTWRRAEVKGVTIHGVTVIDDYAHHPVEIRSTLRGLKEAYSKHRIVCVFQPHTHDRTLKLWKEFSTSFSDAHIVIVPNIYDARPDTEEASVDIASFVRSIAEGSKNTCIDGKSLRETEKLLRGTLLQKNDLLVVMGAGDVTVLAATMTAKNNEK